MKKPLVSVVSALAFAPQPSINLAAEDLSQAGIAVTGEAEIRVPPDEVVLTLGIETRHKDLRETRRLNDLRVKELAAAAQAAGVASKDFRTDYLYLQPEYEYPAGKRMFAGYLQRSTAVITLKELGKFEALMTGALQAGVEYVQGVDFRTSELRKHRDEARVLAIKAAKEKAVALAAALGRKVGKPRFIQEGQGGWRASYGSGWGGPSSPAPNVFQNVSQAGPGLPSTPEAGPMVPGMISVRAGVNVTFELE